MENTPEFDVILRKALVVGRYLVCLIIAGVILISAGVAASATPGDRLRLIGKVEDERGKGIKEAEIEILVNGQPIKPIEGKQTLTTDNHGEFLGEYKLAGGILTGAQVEVQAHKPGWQSPSPTVAKLFRIGQDKEGYRLFQAQQHLTLSRQITPAFWIATLILVLVYAVIAAELMHRTLAAMLGAALILFISYTLGTFNKEYFIISFEDAVRAIDMNVIFLLMGMMMIIGVLKKTGLFQWLACQSYALARGKIFLLSGILMIVTAVLSAFLDNVTTMLLLIPVTIEIALTLKINPITLLIPEVFASNVGGTATLIGDPPNIMIGSYARLSFGDFVVNLTGIIVICLLATLIYYIYWYKKAYLTAEVKDVEGTIVELRRQYRITDRKLLATALIILVFTIFLFVIHGMLHMEPCIAALTGAILLLTIARVNIVELLEHDIEWPTLMFFIGLFIIVAGAEATGLIHVIAEWVARVSQGSLIMAVLMVLWVSALASAFVDNIPFTATMLPIIAFLNETIPGAESGVLWWSLALGACLGGNGTMIGASANVVTVGLAERAGVHISFLYYLRACFVPMLITIILGTAYLLIFKI
ncbi:MAG: ArsB/NhaD family transporter [Deltaproteobacteria bacterium]|nr:ArsB/NhaD family transporter [Deltaproteobacteria bacterium]